MFKYWVTKISTILTTLHLKFCQNKFLNIMQYSIRDLQNYMDLSLATICSLLMHPV